VNHSSSHVHVKFQTVLTSHATIVAKTQYEAMCRDHGVIPQKYLLDNGPAFLSQKFTNHLGRAPSYASSIPLCLNTETGSITTQFHVFFRIGFPQSRLTQSNNPTLIQTNGISYLAIPLSNIFWTCPMWQLCRIYVMN